MAESESDSKITTDTPYLALTGELWDVYCKGFEENWPRYNGTALYNQEQSGCQQPQGIFAIVRFVFSQQYMYVSYNTVISHAHYDITNHWQINHLSNILFRLTTKGIPKHHIAGPLWGNPLVWGESNSGSRSISNSENGSMTRFFMITVQYLLREGQYYILWDKLPR